MPGEVRKSKVWALKLLVQGTVVGGPILKVSTVIQPIGAFVVLFLTMIGSSCFRAGSFKAFTSLLENLALLPSRFFDIFLGLGGFHLTFLFGILTPFLNLVLKCGLPLVEFL